MYDSRLPYGSSLSCSVFQACSDAIVRIASRHGHKIVSYLDDFMIVADDEFSCKKSLDYLVALVERRFLVLN
jgi:hypothetical protein